MLNEIRDIKASVWISASAGTGKTKSIIDRILALLLNDISPEKIVCLTYTNAAATEMLTRLSVYVKKLHTISHDELKLELEAIGFDESYMVVAKGLYEKSISLRWVQIKTIHAFCFNILKKFPLETGMFPGITLCDAFQQQTMLNDIFHEILVNPDHYEDLKNISKYCGGFLELIYKINLHRIQCFLDKNNDIDTTLARYLEINTNVDYENDEYLLEYVFGSGWKKDFLNIASKLESSESKTDIQNAQLLKNSCALSMFEAKSMFFTNKNEKRAKFCTQSIYKIFPELMEDIENLYQKTVLFLEYRVTYEFYKINLSFFRIMKIIIDRLNQLKQQNHCIDFDDVINMANILFYNLDWVMFKLDNSIEHLLVDEAQDTSPQQWEVIKNITNEFFSHYKTNKTIFVVGDEKQSIYSFQGADVKIFNDIKEFFQKRSIECGQNFHIVTLNKSYRTTGNILKFIDTVFSKQYSNIHHISNRSSHTGVVEMIYPFSTDEKHEKSAWEVYTNAEHFVHSTQKISIYIADLIKNILDNNVFVESKNRSAIPGDFLILLQRRDYNLMNCIISELNLREIPVSGVDRIKLIDELMIKDLIVLAKFCTLPLNDLNCAILLKSPIVGISEDDLFHYCINRDGYLWDFVCNNIKNEHKENINKLKSYVEISTKISVYEFYMKILVDGVREKFINIFGNQCVDILNEFLKIVEEFEKKNTQSVTAFISWFESFTHEIKREVLTSSNTVTIMTAHASKGLQSPFVILADALFYSNKKENILSGDEGILYWNFAQDKLPKKIQLIDDNMKFMQIEESLRLLYVAATRAEDFLFITGEQKKNNSSFCWYQYLKQNAGNLLKTLSFSVNNCHKTNYFVDEYIDHTIDNSELIYTIERLGKYDVNHQNVCVQNKSSIHEAINGEFELPQWLQNKNDENQTSVCEVKNKTISGIYGEAIHALLAEINKYDASHIDLIMRNILSQFDLSDNDKELAMQEVYAIFSNKDLDFIFDEHSLSEVSFMHNGHEVRMDKICKHNNKLFIIDFKTGVLNDFLLKKHASQLNMYKEVIENFLKGYDGENVLFKNITKIEIAVLMTKTATLLTINV